MADYITLADVKSHMPESGLSDVSDYDLVLSGLITSVSRLIDREVGGEPNFFESPAATSVRYYDGSGLDEQEIEPAISIAELAVSEYGYLSSSDFTVWDDSDYLTHPYNALPVRSLLVDRLNGHKLRFPNYRRAVRVTGRFGYSETPPADIKQAAIIQVIRWFMRSKQGYAATGASPEIGGMTINVNNRPGSSPRLDPDVAAILWPYKVIV
jgi:hypothetical protein